MYFLIGLSKWGVWIVLDGHKNTKLSTEEYIAHYYRARVHKSSMKIHIKEIISHPLHIILFTITKLVGNMGPHLESKAQMAYGIDCLDPTMFNWCKGFLVNIKD